MYADFESYLEPIQGSNPNPSQPYNVKVNKHIPMSWGVYSTFAYGKVENSKRVYRGRDCIEKFCSHIKEEVHRLYHMFPEK